MSLRGLGSGLAILPFLWFGQAIAQDRPPQYRQLQLSDGREFIAEVLATEATGLRLRVPQGETIVSFERLRDMSPVDGDQFTLQEDWHVYLAVPDELQDPLLEAFRWVPGLRVHLVGDVVPGFISGPMADATRACGQDLSCLVAETQTTPWLWVVTVDAHQAGLYAQSMLNTGTQRTVVHVDTRNRQHLWKLVHTTVGLLPAASGPPAPDRDTTIATVQVPSPSTPSPERDLVRMSYVPVPGLVAARQKNPGGVAMAWAITGVGTAAWVGATGHTAQSTPEWVGLSAIGFYTTSVVANHLTRKRP